MQQFSDLGLAAPILKALTEEGYETPTPIQAKAIPPVLTGADLLGVAQTGTGKTAAFALPILHRLAANRKPPMRKGCRVLVLSPTRELATQIAESFRTYGRHLRISVAVVFGGVGYRPQTQALARGLDVLVATPGRLIDHLEQGNVVLDGTEVFVLDEADQMLDLGFVKPIQRIAAKIPSKRQSLFFSATMPPEIGKLAGQLLREPIKVSVAPAATTVERVAQHVIHIEQTKKRAMLLELFANPALSRTLVFTRTKRGADRVARHLESAGIPVAAIHGDKSQRHRQDALEALRGSQIRVLVATDIAARGIDIDGVTHVVNYELPDVPESYVHRIGRTARAGATGVAISLVDAEEIAQLRDIERVTRQRIPAEDRRDDSSLTAPEASAQSVEGAKRRPSGAESPRGGEQRKNKRRTRRPYPGPAKEPERAAGERAGAANGGQASRKSFGGSGAPRKRAGDGAQAQDRHAGGGRSFDTRQRKPAKRESGDARSSTSPA